MKEGGKKEEEGSKEQKEREKERKDARKYRWRGWRESRDESKRRKRSGDGAS